MPTNTQAFAGNPLDRSCGDRKNEYFLSEILNEESTVAVVSKSGERGKTVLCKKNSEFYELFKCNVQSLLQLCGIKNTEDLLAHNIVVLLGWDKRMSSWLVCIDISSHEFLKLQQLNPTETLVFESGRFLLPKLQSPELAIVGQTLAITSWHDANIFCGRTGHKTIAVECGMKRQVISELKENRPVKLYPRIDPVAIAAVISPDKEHILLGNMKSHPGNFFSCLSGFVEPCESVQEAVCREVWEESGVLVSASRVTTVDSQPWPIGRGGGCELMLGCMAYADSTDINILDPTVNEVRWFSRDEARKMLEASRDRLIGDGGSNGPYIPGDYAIAHHLVKAFVEDDQFQHDTKSLCQHTKSPVTRTSRCSRDVPLHWLIPICFYMYSVS